MAGILDSVNQRTQLVGQNRLELLLFRLVGPQLFGINVFKVREVMPCPRLTTLPGQDSFIKGVAQTSRLCTPLRSTARRLATESFVLGWTTSPIVLRSTAYPAAAR